MLALTLPSRASFTYNASSTASAAQIRFGNIVLDADANAHGHLWMSWFQKSAEWLGGTFQLMTEDGGVKSDGGGFQVGGTVSDVTSVQIYFSTTSANDNWDYTLLRTAQTV